MTLTAWLLRGLWYMPFGEAVHSATQLWWGLWRPSVKTTLAPMKPQWLLIKPITIIINFIYKIIYELNDFAYILHGIGHHWWSLQCARGRYLSAPAGTGTGHSCCCGLLLGMTRHALVLWLEARVAVHEAAVVSGPASWAAALSEALLTGHEMWAHRWHRLLVGRWRCALRSAWIARRAIKCQMSIRTLCCLVV